jgi:hypothetical protein
VHILIEAELFPEPQVPMSVELAGLTAADCWSNTYASAANVMAIANTKAAHVIRPSRLPSARGSADRQPPARTLGERLCARVCSGSSALTS